MEMAETTGTIESRVTRVDTTLHQHHAPWIDSAMLVMRLWLGATMITHGWPKVFGGMEKFTTGVAEMGFPAPEVFAWAAALSELAGGLLLGLGLATRATSLLV